MRANEKLDLHFSRLSSERALPEEYLRFEASLAFEKAWIRGLLPRFDPHRPRRRDKAAFLLGHHAQG